MPNVTCVLDGASAVDYQNAMNKILIPAISIAAAGAVAFGIVKMNSADETQKHLDELSAKLGQQEKSLADALAGINSARSDMDALRAQNEFLKSERDKAEKRAKEAAENAAANAGIASAPVDSPEKQGQEAIKNIAQAFAKGMDDPEVKKIMRSGQTRMISGVYDGLFKKLNLSEADQQVVSELISERNMAAFDKGRKLIGAKADDATIAATRKEIETTKAEYDAKLRGVVGEQRFAEKTLGEQRSVDSFARNLERKGVPLEPAKKEALLGIMQDERLKIAGDDIPDLGGGPGMAVLLTEAEAKARQVQEDQYEANVMAQAAQAGLSPDQINALQDSFKQRREGQTMGRAFGRAFLGGGLGGGNSQPAK
jgi:hypothetical protein